MASLSTWSTVEGAHAGHRHPPRRQTFADARDLRRQTVVRFGWDYRYGLGNEEFGATKTGTADVADYRSP
jgi:hypothetical protein